MIRATAILLVTALALSASPLSAQEESPAGSMPTTNLQVLLEKVAADSGKKFLVDARVEEMVYVGGTSNEDPSYPVLLSILRNNGLVAVEIEGYVNIVPDAIARQLPVRLVQRDDPDIPEEAWVSRVIEVNNAAYFVPILRPLLPQHGHLAAGGGEPQSNKSNKLLIVGSYAEVKRITEIVNAMTE